MCNSQPYYTIYNDLTDEIIAAGTKAECMEQLNISFGSFSSMISNIKNKRNRKYGKYAVVIENIDPQEQADDSA